MPKTSAGQAPAVFSVDLARVHAVGLATAGAVPGSAPVHAAYEHHGLLSHERLYHELVTDLSLVTTVFRPGEAMGVAGQEVADAYLVRDGVLSVQLEGGPPTRIGAGSVIGLAEGLTEGRYRMTVVAQTVVTANVIPLHRARKATAGMHLGLRGITRNTVMRILKNQPMPERLL